MVPVPAALTPYPDPYPNTCFDSESNPNTKPNPHPNKKRAARILDMVFDDEVSNLRDQLLHDFLGLAAASLLSVQLLLKEGVVIAGWVVSV